MSRGQSELVAQYKKMYEERASTNPAAFTLEFWKDHFATKTVCESREIQGEVLDLGCGTGEIDIWLARAKGDARITAVDVSPDALEVARRHLLEEPQEIQKRISFHESVIDNLPFEDNTFDACLLSHTLEHIEDPDALFRELYRVLRSQAAVLVIVPLGSAYNDPTHVWHFRPEQLGERLRFFGENVQVWTSPDDQQIAARLHLRRKPKIVCMMRIRNEEAWIVPTLEKAAPLVDGFVILDDGSTDRTPELCRAFPKVIRYEYQNEAATDEARDKDRLLQWALDENPDWILALDGDELLEDIAPITLRRELSVCPPDVSAVGFTFLYMWDSHDRHRMDGQYGIARHPRLFRVAGLGTDPRTLRFPRTRHGANFHCGSIPANLPGQRRYIDVCVKHYGYFDKSQREQKQTFYEQTDPENAARGFYNHLTDDQGMILFPWRERSASDVVYSDGNPDDVITTLQNAGNSLPMSGLCYLPGSKTHLDVASGSGDTLRGLDPKHVICVEKRIPLANGLRDLYPKVIEDDPCRAIETLAQSGEKFDRVTICNCLHELPRPEAEGLLETAERIAMREIIVFVPAEGRDCAEYNSHWTLDDFCQRGYDIIELRNPNVEGVTGFFAAKYISTTHRELALIRLQNYLDKEREKTAGQTGASQGQPLSTSTVRPLHELPPYYRYARPEIISAVPPDATNILDIGCGAGLIGKTLKEENSRRRVVGIEINDEAVHYAKLHLDTAYHADVECFDPPFRKGEFDCLVFGDILEHLKDPWSIARRYATYLKPGGTVVVSVPNIRHIQMLRELAELGTWEYQDAGILDRTHLRFFTLKELVKLLNQADIKIQSIRPISCLGDDEVGALRPHGPERVVRAGNFALFNVSDEEFAELCATQFLCTGTYQAKADSSTGEEVINDQEDEPVQKQKLVSVVVLAHNQLSYTKKCLASLQRHTTVPYELVVVDNASTDGTDKYLARFQRRSQKAEQQDGASKTGGCKAVKILRHEENLGFAAGNNAGIAAAEGDYVVLLNNDVVVTPGWLERLLRSAEQDPSVGIVGPMTNCVSGPQHVETVSYQTSALEGLDEFADRWAKQYAGESIPFWRAVGFCMLIKRAVIHSIGGLDTRYGLGNFEDDDFCVRAAIAGFGSAIAKDCFVHHFGGRTFSGQQIDYKQLLHENWEIFKQKWGLPQDLPYGTPHDLSAVLGQPFDPKLHRCPVTADADGQSPDTADNWFAAPQWEDAANWKPIIEEYVRSHTSDDGALLSLYAGPLTGSTPQQVHQQVAELLPQLDLDPENCPDIEITSELPADQSTRIILAGGPLDEKLCQQFTHRCVPLSALPKAA